MIEHPGRRDRYVVGEEIAAGGMATVHLGAMVGDAGFVRTVAIKRLHPQYARDPEFSAMLIDEGHLAARIAHVHVVATLDVVASSADLFMVMEYVHGEPLNRLLRAVVRRGERIPAPIAAGILAGALRGLHAAHEARDAYGRLLGVVHRDVSPQNIMVGIDGVARVLDFGIAKAAGRTHTTATGQIKGKFAYMPPEQLHAEELDLRADVYAAGVVLWEALVGARLFAGADQAPNLAKLIDPKVEPPSARAPALGTAYDDVTLRALQRDRDARFPTALAMAEALEACGPVALPGEIGAWVQAVGGEALAERARRIAAAEKALAQRIRDSFETLDALEETIADVHDLELPTLPASPRSAPSPSAASPALEASPPRRAGVVRRALVPAVAVIALGAALVLLLRSGRRDQAVAPAAEVAAPPSATLVAAPLPAPPTAVTEASAPRLPPSSSARPPRPRPAADACSPPFTIDAQGHKHFKRACLR
ncbi:serine/threonine protein kinase [Minicystis rosea]|nr:serine/threonine protein kinase [Minicystis rosea]